MSGNDFLKGAAVGLVIGSAAGIMMVPEKRRGCKKKSIGKAIKTVGEVVENFTDFIGI